jgi:hypothetical protein
MGLTDEEMQVLDELVAAGIACAQELDGLVEPDEATRRILMGVMGLAFAVGRAYERTPAALPWRLRLHLARVEIEAP